MDKVTKDIQGDIPWCILFVDDAVLIYQTKVGVKRKFKLWRQTLKIQGV
jgi:hypothetical protein